MSRRLIAAATAAPLLVTLGAWLAPPADAAPTCTPGDALRQGYICSPTEGWGYSNRCIQVWRSYPRPMHLETVRRGPR